MFVICLSVQMTGLSRL